MADSGSVASDRMPHPQPDGGNRTLVAITCVVLGTVLYYGIRQHLFPLPDNFSGMVSLALVTGVFLLLRQRSFSV